MTIKEIIERFQNKVIDRVSKGSLDYSDKEKIRKINNKVFIISLLIFESIGMSIIFLKIIPENKGWPFAQTSILLSILFVLTIPLFQKKK